MQSFLAELEYLFERYSMTRRATTQPYLWQVAHTSMPDYKYHPDDDLVRETLIEHVGSLPIMAIAFYPHIQDAKVDLGQALTMMAIHDIGELKTGDEMTFTKKADAAQVEYDAALEILHPTFHETYEIAEGKKNQSALFAKAIDKITPDILDYLTPKELTLWRYKHYTGADGADEIIDLIIKFKRPHMTWNPFMTEFHKHLMGELKTKLS